MKKKLQLKKETIAVLNGDNMRNVVGGENQCRMDAECPPDQQCVDGFCIANASDPTFGPACTIVATITLSAVTLSIFTTADYLGSCRPGNCTV